MNKKRPKRTPTKEEYPHDRITFSARRGYKDWIEKAALQLNLDKSKMARLAIEDYIKARRGDLSVELLKEFEELRLGHGPGRYGDSLL